MKLSDKYGQWMQKYFSIKKKKKNKYQCSTTVTAAAASISLALSLPHLLCFLKF